MNTAAASRPARARLGPWPHERDVVHLVLLDHQMVPTPAQVADWEHEAAALGGTTVRTGALFPNSTPAFREAGYRTADTLTLLELRLDAADAGARRRTPRAPGVTLRRLRPSMLLDAAAIERRSFSLPWSNDPPALAEIMAATPQHRSRCVVDRGTMVAFSISGRADDKGYVQRLAVDPSARHRGLATLLLADALTWMRRRNVVRVMVNTAVDNTAALALYQSVGFVPQPDPLVILERDLSPR